MIYPWLPAQWSELLEFLSLDLTNEWHVLAVIRVSLIPPDVPYQQIAMLFTSQSTKKKIFPLIFNKSEKVTSISTNKNILLFETVFQTLMQSMETREYVIPLLQTLINSNFPSTAAIILKIFKYEKITLKFVEAIFTTIVFTVSDIIFILEHLGMWYLNLCASSSALLQKIEQYLVHFSSNDLNRSSARSFLKNLNETATKRSFKLSEENQALLGFWYKISEFIDEPLLSSLALKDLSYTIRKSPLITNNMQLNNLRDILIQIFVELIESEIELVRVIDNIGLILNKANTRPIFIMGQMLQIIVEKYEKKKLPPGLLLPYIKVALWEARYLSISEKEKLIESCLTHLRHLDVGPFSVYEQSIKMWPTEMQDEWRSFWAKL